MNALDKLEERIEALLADKAHLAKENARLRVESEMGVSALETENHSLRDELAAERAKSDEVLARVEKLLQKLQTEPPPHAFGDD